MNLEQEIEAMSTHAPSPCASRIVPWSDGVAIIGMSARFPRSRNVQEFWGHLLAGDDLISDLTEDELRLAGVNAATLADPSYVRRGSAIENAESIDAELFGLSPREAAIVDPQQRVLLECAWEALESSGHTGESRSVGVFAGAGLNSYAFQLLANPEVIASTGSYQLMIASDKDFLTSRIAYKLNLRGPAVTVQTACSTSLAAVHLACRSLLDGECEMALAGGVSIGFPQPTGYQYIPGLIFSPDGYCRPFDARAQGTVPGRGAGMVLLKCLEEARADGDHIYAVIRGSAWNNDGNNKVGYTAPSIDGQAEVIRAALRAAAISPAQIGYVETHGTATELGDSIEVAALASVFSEEAHPGPCVLGALKANMGHADCAAGIAALIKAALAVDSGLIPPTPHFERPNPALALDTTPFVINSSTVQWPKNQERWAGVSSFGIGGTNVHVVLSAASQVLFPDHPSRRQIFPVSGRTPSALNAACEQLAQSAMTDASLDPADVAFTLQRGRRTFAHRRAVVAETCAEAASLLRDPNKDPADGEDLSRSVVFLFPGQGEQFIGMAETLYRTDAAFRQSIDNGCAVLRDTAQLDLLPFIAGCEDTPDLRTTLNETRIAQPLLFLVEYILAERWRSLGVEPAGLLGHSLGELIAASVAGVFTFEHGLLLAAERGRLMAATPPGLMLAVMLPPAELTKFLDSNVWLAAENGPGVSVASGTVEAIENLEERLSAAHVASVRLASRNAFHTPLMAEAAKRFRSAVAAVPLHSPTIPWLSNVTGTWIEPDEAQTPQYWGLQILSRVRLRQSLVALAGQRRILIEVGPGEALCRAARKQMPSSVFVSSLGQEDRRVSGDEVFLRAIASVWEAGVSIDWTQLQAEERCRRVPLPTYPFERQRYWIAPAKAGSSLQPTAILSGSPAARAYEDIAPVKRSDITSWFYAPRWQSTSSAEIALAQRNEPIKCWLILLDDTGIGAALIPLLQAGGQTVVSISRASSFSWDVTSATLNPAVPSGYESLWEQMSAAGLQPDGVLNLWPLATGTPSCFESMVLLLQAGGSMSRRIRSFEFVTDSLESVTGERIERPQRAELYGLARVISHEMPASEWRTIDLRLADAPPSRLAQLLMAELARWGGDISVAYRKGRRFQKQLLAVPLPLSIVSPFQTGGTYLITGGVGGIGYALAHRLLSRYQARVVLTGRTHLPAISEWATWLSEHGEKDAIARRIHRMQELQSAGGEVLFVPADVTDRDAMKAVLESIHERYGRLDGVVHAAGIAGESMISEQDLEQARSIRNPKVQGSVVLADLLREHKLDFLLFCSSIAAIAPASGQGAYAAANAFLNTFAEHCRIDLDLPAVAIGLDAWQEVGMAAESEVPEWLEPLKRERLHLGISSQEGMEIIERVLAQWHEPQIITSTVSLGRILAHPRPIAASVVSEATARDAVASGELATILDIWKEVLSVENVEPNDNFFSLGGHSLMGVMMMARIRDRLGVILPVSQVFETPTPAGIAACVRSEITQDVPKNTNGDTATNLELETVPQEDREEFEF